MNDEDRNSEEDTYSEAKQAVKENYLDREQGKQTEVEDRDQLGDESKKSQSEKGNKIAGTKEKENKDKRIENKTYREANNEQSSDF